MKRKYLIVIICVSGLLLTSLFERGKIYGALKGWLEKDRVLVVNTPIKAKLFTGKEPLTIEGTLNLHLESSWEKLEKGIVNMRGFNLVFSNVPQEAISGKPTETKYASLGIPLPAINDIELSIDAERHIFSAHIPIRAHFSQIDEIFPPKPPNESEKKDYSLSQTQKGILTININPQFGDAAVGDQIIQAKAISLSAHINVDPLTIDDKTIPGYEIDLADAPLQGQIADVKETSVTKHYCVQPISIRNDPSEDINGNATGKSLAASEGAIKDLWGDFGVAIDVREWMYIDNPGGKDPKKPDWKTADEDEVADILAEVRRKRISNCIGVVFVENFQPLFYLGGGWTDRAGTSEPIIITSDGNIANNDDMNLAHELGHAFGLKHPNDPDPDPNLHSSTPGTLMCPSGWGAPNIRKNSVENLQNIAGGAFEVVENSSTTPLPQKQPCDPYNPSNRCEDCNSH